MAISWEDIGIPSRTSGLTFGSLVVGHEPLPQLISPFDDIVPQTLVPPFELVSTFVMKT